MNDAGPLPSRWRRRGPAGRRLVGLLAALLLVGGIGYLARSGGFPRVPSGPPARISATGAALPVALSFATEPGLLVVDGRPLASALELADGATYGFPADFTPAGPDRYTLTSVRDKVLGPAVRITADYQSTDGALDVTIAVLAATQRPALLYQMTVKSSDSEFAVERFSPLDEDAGGLDLPGPVDYLTLLSTGAVQGTIAAGGAPIGLPLSQGAPLRLWSERASRGYIFALLDETASRTGLRLASSNNELRLRLQTGPRRNTDDTSPRVYLERVTTPNVTAAFAGYRAALDVVAPAPPTPPGFRQQWGSWYVYGGGITEDLIRQQIDTIATTYADLGPWQIVVDAGWYRSGADPDGEVGVVDPAKFPSGMRAVVDYAHARGVGVVLYGSAPWLDSHLSTDAWWVVQLGFIRDHPDWLILVEQDAEGATYVYDLSNPDLRAYLAGLVRRYVVDFNVDGILLDMVGIIGPEGGRFRGAPRSRGVPQPLPELAQTMQIYRSLWQTATRLKPGVWIETGWAAPPLARSYAHTWRLADDYPAFSNPYPAAGLLEQLTYAVLQEQLLGRRPHVGFIWGAEDTLPVQREWLATAVALQAQTILSINLASASAGTTQMYREYLAALRPFSTTPIFGPGIPPEAFSTTVNGTTYLGLLNTSDAPRTVTVDLADHRPATSASMLAFDPSTREAFTAGRRLSATVPARSVRLLVLRSEPGVLWADRSWTARQDERGRLQVGVEPSPWGDGELWLYAPGTQEVTIDSVPSTQWAADAGSGLVTVGLEGGAGRQLTVGPASGRNR